jgi:hypothetical protein
MTSINLKNLHEERKKREESNIHKMSLTNKNNIKIIENKNEGEIVENNSEELVENKNEELHDNNNKELHDNKNEELNDNKNEELVEDKSEELVDINNKELNDNKSEELVENKSEELVENKSEELVENKNEKIVEDKNEKIVENKSEELVENTSTTRCRICYEEDGVLLHPCKCDGSIKWVHTECLKKWISTSKKDYCPQCNYKYKYEKFCNYPRLEKFVSKRKYIKLLSLLAMVFLIFLFAFIKRFICNYLGYSIKKSLFSFFFDGIKILILNFMIIVPILHYKGIINIYNTITEYFNSSYFVSSNIYEVTALIYLIFIQLTDKMINKYIKIEYKFINYVK